ncbi:YeiH family protein [Arachidicoccus sp.]|uniref:YeiH family protein n=1 Tax=Arachidicoccus sp. TaxID=1872624 RepID=UPI003D1B60B1
MEKGILYKVSAKKILFIVGILVCCFPIVSPPIALILGFILTQTVGHPLEEMNHRIVKILLQCSVVGLGFGMSIFEAVKAGKEGFVFTVCSIFITLLLGLLLGKLLKIKKITTFLISAGTAICGGSAIAAVAPLVEAKESEMSVSLGTVFLLNSVALFVFPLIGHLFHLSQNQFGLWAAIAIHDTSSVVGAASKYGLSAMHIATTVKLERALWIIPVSLLTAFFYRKGKGKIKLPYFILLFVVAMLLNTFLPFIHPVGKIIVPLAEKSLTLTLFFIGAGLTSKALKQVGAKPLLLGILLWIFISVSSLLVILHVVL